MSDEERISALEKRIDALEAADNARREWGKNRPARPAVEKQKVTEVAIRRNSRGELR
jgi:hypothetical protein